MTQTLEKMVQLQNTFSRKQLLHILQFRISVSTLGLKTIFFLRYFYHQQQQQPALIPKKFKDSQHSHDQLSANFIKQNISGTFLTYPLQK